MNSENIADKKKAIFDSTLELIQENGFHGTPMSLVAKNAGVAAGTIYHYFESKDKLICELFCYLENKRVNLIHDADTKDKPYQERFFSIWMSLYRFYINHPTVLKFFEQFVNSPYYTKKYGNEHDQFHTSIFKFFEEGVNAGHLRQVNPQILAVLAHGSTITASKIYWFGKIELGDKELQQIIQILWDGMRKDQNTPPN